MSTEERDRRRIFQRWLLKAWDWAEDQDRTELAERIAELLTHVEEEDFPLWEAAGRLGLLTGGGKIAEALRKAHGIPLAGPKAVGWEREINFCPTITLDATVFETIYSGLGWANRTPDLGIASPNMYLWSPSGNIVRFVKREVIPIKEIDDAVV